MSTLSIPVGPHDHTFGPDDAPVTLVEYGDYQCPSCLMASRVVDKLVRHFGDRMRFVFRHFPLSQHEFAEGAAEVAEFAASEGKFWPMHHALYAHQNTLSEGKFAELAQELGLDAQKAAAAVSEQRFAQRIRDDEESGKESGVHGTPTFFLNGKAYRGPADYDGLAAAIEAAL